VFSNSPFGPVAMILDDYRAHFGTFLLALIIVFTLRNERCEDPRNGERGAASITDVGP
jgi:hypothetical protein